MNYSKAVTQRSGAKVGWLYYRTEAEAERASRLAEKEASRKAAQGYDFGFLSPGSIHHCDKGEYAGLWQVVIP